MAGTRSRIGAAKNGAVVARRANPQAANYQRGYPADSPCPLRSPWVAHVERGESPVSGAPVHLFRLQVLLGRAPLLSVMPRKPSIRKHGFRARFPKRTKSGTTFAMKKTARADVTGG